MAFKQIKLHFQGSFQCRLATNADPPDSSRSDPYGDLRLPASTGWTFDYDEPRFDRIIRTASPVALRAALVDDFVPTKVTGLEAQPEALFGVELPFQSVPGDPLLGLPVSLGSNPMFDEAAGGGATFEHVLNCNLSFGTLLTATPTSTPHLTGVSDTGAGSEYLLKKPPAIAAALAAGGIVPTRVKVLTEEGPTPLLPKYMQAYAGFFGAKASTEPVVVSLNFSPAGASGILASILFGWTWKLILTFSRFDGDTLTGRLDGELHGVHSNV
ncbi:hypothetical protein OHT76_43550 [Streptomyces sp. NBC_00287]|uniref:hypothetical protein n=1 Tax=Streptomyces sp. NBC_00287 TaxID=2975702 RepID=UPI002E2D1AF0|nr:hypothetical protein [Streptomyces sp. NBC_00287]